MNKLLTITALLLSACGTITSTQPIYPAFTTKNHSTPAVASAASTPLLPTFTSMKAQCLSTEVVGKALNDLNNQKWSQPIIDAPVLTPDVIIVHFNLYEACVSLLPNIDSSKCDNGVVNRIEVYGNVDRQSKEKVITKMSFYTNATITTYTNRSKVVEGKTTYEECFDKVVVSAPKK